MNNEVETAEQPVAIPSTVAQKAIDFAKVDALRKHMLLTVTSMCVILGASRVSYYGWLKGAVPRAGTAKQLRETVRKLVGCVTQGWPDAAVYVASQPQRLIMLQDLLKNLDNESVTQ